MHNQRAANAKKSVSRSAKRGNFKSDIRPRLEQLITNVYKWRNAMSTREHRRHIQTLTSTMPQVALISCESIFALLPCGTATAVHFSKAVKEIKT